ncbi:MAG TPA: hypothetical protein VHX63_02910 [Acidobacteriaceae bacterium]|nr:hypothetical protein [Acidobacteriaceae bacterium]
MDVPAISTPSVSLELVARFADAEELARETLSLIADAFVATGEPVTPDIIDAFFDPPFASEASEARVAFPSILTCAEEEFSDASDDRAAMASELDRVACEAFPFDARASSESNEEELDESRMARRMLSEKADGSD